MNKELLFNLLRVQSHSRECIDMQTFIVEYIESMGWHYDIDKMGNIYVTKGIADTYPCFASHMDTVHYITKGGIQIAELYDGDVLMGINPTTMMPTGIGGDDKCGIYAALNAMGALPTCKAAFFVDEEIGCVGSYQANMAFFSDCRFVLQADRRGNDDFVTDIFGGISSDKFQDDILPIITDFGYKFCDGMMTDVQALRDNDIGISVANMSAGYYRPHSANEYICLTDLENVCNMMLEICEKLTDVYPYTYTRPAYKYKPYVKYFPKNYANGWAMDDERQFDEPGNMHDSYAKWWNEKGFIDMEEEARETLEEEEGYIYGGPENTLALMGPIQENDGHEMFPDEQDDWMDYQEEADRIEKMKREREDALRIAYFPQDPPMTRESVF